jgi:hypothetical protein
MAFDIQSILGSLFGQNQQQPSNMLAQAGQPQAMPPQNQLAAVAQPQQQPMTQPQMPPQQAQAPQSGGLFGGMKNFGDSPAGQRLNDMFVGWAMGATPQDSIGKGAYMVSQGNRERKVKDGQNQTVEYLKSQGMPEGEAKLLAGNQPALAEYLKSKMSKRGPIEVNGQLVDPNTYQVLGDFRTDKTGGSTEYGLNPQYGVDAQGNPVIIQLGKDATSKQTPLPAGVSLSKEPIKLDAGTHFVLLDPITRQPVGTIPKENMQAAKDTAIGTAAGKAQGDAMVGLGSSLQKADQSIGLIDTMLKHPGLDTAVGASSVWDPRNYMAGTDATNFNVMRKQLEGKAFLEAFESLKGAGQITEVEGTKATEAIARLSTAQSEDAYRSALTELKGILEQGKQRSIQRAGGGNPTAAPADAPSLPQPKRLIFNPATGALE